LKTDLRYRKFFLVLIILSFLLLPWNFSQTEIDILELNRENISFYQNNPCEISIFELNSNVGEGIEVEYHSDISKSVECFGKVSWISNTENKAKVYIATNFNVDILYQSIFWLFLIYLIPKSNKSIYSINVKSIIATMFLTFLHLKGEGTYYKIFSREYDSDLISKEFNGDFYYENFFLYAFLVALFLILYLLKDLLETRYTNLINYFPYLFLVMGAYNSFNLNFFVIIFTLIGINSLLKYGVNFKLYYLYIFFVSAWFYNSNSQYSFFDVDKLKGFINSSQSNISLIFWILVFPFSVVGIVSLVKQSKENLNIDLLRKNFLISGSLIVALGYISAISKTANFFSYYFLGLNKFGMRTLESVVGNSWRGLTPSAEGVGEFFGFVILFAIITSYNKKILLNKYDVAFLVINFYGLYKSNNFAALTALIGLFSIFLIENSKLVRKTKISIYLFSFIGLTFFYFNFINIYNYQDLSKSMLAKAVIASEIPVDFAKNEIGDTAVEKSNFAVFLQIPKEERNFSTSLNYLLEKYNKSGSNNIPNIISLVSVLSVIINRSEKWGIFISKYNPDIGEFLFGYGPQQLSTYHNQHVTKFNDGLVIPHSSLLNYLIFFGIIGVILILVFIMRVLIDNKNHLYKNYLVIYLVINALKSDALLYFQNLVLLIIILFAYFRNKKEEINLRDV
tara:strand:+ start:128 stop:2167 length:2040 start_codon:yes stop_codon:yes gene_type:complete